MKITPRIRQILQFLLEQLDYVREQDIADAIGSSKRTVQRELQYISSELGRRELTLERKKGLGLRLAGPAEAMAALRLRLDGQPSGGFASKAERQQRLLFELLHDRTPQKLYVYSRLLNVSEATVATDMEEISPWLAESHLTIVKKPGYGVVLTGSEADYREALGRFIHAFAPQGQPMGGTTAGIYDFLNSDTISRVEKLLDGLSDVRLQRFTETSYMGLVMHIVIGIERVRQGALTDGSSDVLELADDEDKELAQRILGAIEQEFQLRMPQVELSYLLLHIKGAKIRYQSNSENVLAAGVNETDIFELIDRMITAFGGSAAAQLRLDEEFLHGLYIHLQPTIVRLKNHLSIVNPLLADIKREYAEIFQRTAQAAAVITETYGFPVGEEEISYLAIHFGAALERMKGHTGGQLRTVEIGVVCASGFGLARLMLAKLRNKLGTAAELHAYGQKDITPEILQQTDFFLSSMPLVVPADVLRISPLVGAADVVKIQEKITAYAHVRKETAAEDSGFTEHLDQTERAAAAIQAILTGYTNIPVPAGLTFSALLQTLAARVTPTEAAATSLAALLQRRERINSQLFPSQGFALLHGISDTVDKPVFITAAPLGGSFTAPELQEIHIAILMVIPETADQWMLKEIMGTISTALVTEDSFAAALQLGDTAGIQQHLSRILKNYFQALLRQFA